MNRPVLPRDIRRHLPVWAAALALLGTFVLAQATGEKAPSAPPPIPVRRGWPFWKPVLYRTYAEINQDRLLALAAGVVFYALLALFPAITALVSSYALFAKPSTIVEHLAAVSGMVPASAYLVANEQIARIVSRTSGDLSLAFFVSLAIVVWSANAGAKAIIDALNICYGVTERRSFLQLTAISLSLTLGALAGLLLTLGAVVAVPVMVSYLPFSSFGTAALTWLRWPAMIVVLMLGLAVLYRFGPDRDRPRWHWLSAGNVFAALAWLAGSVLLSWYLTHFADYAVAYGSLGAGVALMMWLWLSAVVVLVGAELNSEVEAAAALRREQPGAGGL